MYAAEAALFFAEQKVMEMSEYSRVQERAEKRRIASGVKLSVFGLLLCWVPFLGVLLSSVGFVKVMSSTTARYRARQRSGTAIAALILAVSLAVTTAEVYQYTHNPWLLDDLGSWVLDRLTGGDYSGSYDYSNQYNPSMGMSDDLYAQGYTPSGYYDESGAFVPYAEADGAPDGEYETGG